MTQITTTKFTVRDMKKDRSARWLNLVRGQGMKVLYLFV